MTPVGRENVGERGNVRCTSAARGESSIELREYPGPCRRAYERCLAEREGAAGRAASGGERVGEGCKVSHLGLGLEYAPPAAPATPGCSLGHHSPTGPAPRARRGSPTCLRAPEAPTKGVERTFQLGLTLYTVIMSLSKLTFSFIT